MRARLAQIGCCFDHRGGLMVVGREEIHYKFAAALRWGKSNRHVNPSTAIFLILVLCQFLTGIAYGTDQRTIDAAKKEGKVVWYTVAGESAELAKTFEAKYPFVKVEVLRSTVFPLLNRILNEARGSNNQMSFDNPRSPCRC